MKIAVKLRGADAAWDKYLERLGAAAETLLLYDNALCEKYGGVEIMITTRIDKPTLLKFPDLEKLFLFKTGMDGLPLDELKNRGISVIPSHANSDIIAEHALSLALALLHRIPEFHNDLTRGIWYSDGADHMWRSINSFKIGILGFGSIGRSLYDKLLPLNRDITVLNKSGKYPDGIKHAASFNRLISDCDLIFICVPKAEDTVDMFNADVLGRMSGKYLVNIARAEICNEKALFTALSENRLAGYASDVWYRGSDKTNKSARIMPSDYPFEKLRNVLLSPHCATHEQAAHERYINDAVNAVLKEIKGNDSV